MDNQFDLDRFVSAQDPVYSDVLAELRTGKKRSHWMWFVFPQIARLVATHADMDIGDIFDGPDDRKFHSSMTLFADVAPDEAVFQTCLDQFFDGRPDAATLARL
jgi:uncharacterized protein (DUF1810 family)